LLVGTLFEAIIGQETPQCDETRFSTLQLSIDMTGIKKMKDGSKEKVMPLFWLHQFAPSLVSIGQNKLKLLSGNRISIFSNSDLDHRHLSSIQSFALI